MQPLRRATSRAAIAIGVVVGLLAASVTGPAHATTAQASPAMPLSAPFGVDSGIRTAADLSRFDPGNIISDEVFFDPWSMDEAEISSFLRGKVASCRSGYICLKDFTQTTTSRSGDSYCQGYQGGANEPAARIIVKVAHSCGINPQVLLVTLQKEQGLVTHTWPSDWRYTIAMGQGCPDTAACDTRYYGFQNQVYGAARQFKIYAEGRYFTYYAPGKTWNILYNPSRTCGSAPVYVANRATAGLYYYTPYQPNAAALRAGYGEGDSCSSYGNRNFYNYFSDWFGSTYEPVGSLVKSPGSPAVYLVIDGVRRHVQTQEDLAVFSARLGAVRWITDSRMSRLPMGPAATRLARDAASGAMYLLQKDGTKHHFTSAEHVVRYGFAMDNYVHLSASSLASYATGADVSNAFRADDSPDYFVWDNGTRRHIMTAVAWGQLGPVYGNYVAVIAREAVSVMPVGAPIIGAGVLVKEQNSSSVYVTGSGLELLHTPSWSLAEDAGISARFVVPDTTLRQYKVVGSLAPVLVCDAQPLLVGSRGLTPLLGGAPAGTQVTVPSSLCSAFPRTSVTIPGRVFVSVTGTDRIYVLENNMLRHVRDGVVLQRLAGQSAVVTTKWSSDTAMRLPQGAPFLSDGSFVQFGDDRIFMAEKETIRHVTSPQVLTRLAGGRPIVVETLGPALLAAYPQGAPIS